MRLTDVRDDLDVPESFAPIADKALPERWHRALKHTRQHREEVLAAFDEEDRVVYALESEEPRTTPQVLVVDTDREEYRADEGGSGDYPDHHYRIHCSYCRGVFTGNDHANAVSHLRRHHGIDDPYQPTRPRIQNAADSQDTLPGREKMMELVNR